MRKRRKRRRGRRRKRPVSFRSRPNAKNGKKGEGRSWNGANVRKRPAGRRKIFLWRKSLNRKGVFPNP